MNTDSLLPVLMNAALRSALLLAGATLAWPFFRKYSAATKHLVWLGALAGALLLPLLAAVLPSWQVAWLPHWAPPAAAPTAEIAAASFATLPKPAIAPAASETASAQPAGATPEMLPHFVSAPIAEEGRGLASTTASWPSSALLGLWLAGTIIALLPLAAGTLRASWLARRGQKLDSAEWGEDLREISRQLGLRRTVRLLAAPAVTMPFTCGVFRPEVVFPAAAANWPRSRRRLVLLHEIGHIARHDWAAQITGTVACAVYWFNPLAWLAAWQMRLERELACDDLVLGSGQPAKDYARELLGLAAASSRVALPDWATVPMARRSTLEMRLLSIFDQQRRRGGLSRQMVAGLAVAGLAMTASIAVLRAAGPSESAASSVPVAASASSLSSGPAPTDGSTPLASPSPSQSQPAGTLTLRFSGNSDPTKPPMNALGLPLNLSSGATLTLVAADNTKIPTNQTPSIPTQTQRDEIQAKIAALQKDLATLDADQAAAQKRLEAAAVDATRKQTALATFNSANAAAKQAPDPTTAKTRADYQKRIEALQLEIEAMAQNYGLAYLDPKSGLLATELQSANQLLVEAQRELDIQTDRLNKVRMYREEKKSLAELPFIAADPRVSKAMDALTESDAKLSALEDKLGNDHTLVTAEFKQRDLLAKNLSIAVNVAARAQEINLSSARDIYEQRLKRLHEIQERIMQASKVQVRFDALRKQLDELLRNQPAPESP